MATSSPRISRHSRGPTSAPPWRWRAAVACLLAVGCTAGAQGATDEFLGTVDNTWENDANWSLGVAPVDGDDVVISAPVLLASTSAGIASLNLAYEVDIGNDSASGILLWSGSQTWTATNGAAIVFGGSAANAISSDSGDAAILTLDAPITGGAGYIEGDAGQVLDVRADGIIRSDGIIAIAIDTTVEGNVLAATGNIVVYNHMAVTASGTMASDINGSLYFDGPRLETAGSVRIDGGMQMIAETYSDYWINSGTMTVSGFLEGETADFANLTGGTITDTSTEDEGVTIFADNCAYNAGTITGVVPDVAGASGDSFEMGSPDLVNFGTMSEMYLAYVGPFPPNGFADHYIDGGTSDLVGNDAGIGFQTVAPIFQVPVPVSATPVEIDGFVGQALPDLTFPDAGFFNVSLSGLSLTAINPPPGLEGDLMHGTHIPTAAGTYTVVLVGDAPHTSGFDRYGETVATFVITVPSAPVLTLAPLTVGVHATFDDALSATGGVNTWSATGLPTGVTLEPTSGHLYGRADAAGTYPLSITATNAGGADTEAMVLTVTQDNDDFANAFAITGDDVVVDGDNTYATKEAGEPDHAGDAAGQSMWWSYTTTTTGTLTIDAGSSDFAAVAGVYRGGAVGGLTLVAASDGAWPLVATVPPGTYMIAVDGAADQFAAYGAISLHVTFSAATAASNDDFADAYVIGGTAASISANNTGATHEVGETAHAGKPARASLWWTYTAATAGTLSVDTIGSGVDTVLGVYTGSTVDALTAVAENDNGVNAGTASRIVVAVGPGTYAIAVDSATTRTGAISLHLSFAATPANDAFANAIPVTLDGSNQAVLLANSAGATKEPGEPNHAGRAGGASLWWSFVAPVDGFADISTAGSDFNTVLAVYTGATVDRLTAVAANDNASRTDLTSEVLARVKAGCTYSIAVDGGSSSAVAGVIHLAVTLNPSPLNDNFADATPIGAPGTVTGSNAFATSEPGEPNHAGYAGGHSVWWSWTATDGGTVSIDTVGSGFSTLLAVYTGSDVAHLQVVAADRTTRTTAPQSLVTFTEVPGTTYAIAVDGIYGVVGAVTLHLSVIAAEDAFANARTIGSAAGSDQISNDGASKEAGEPNHATNAAGHSVWWNYVATIDGKLYLSTEGSIGDDGNPLDTVIGVYTGTRVGALTTVATDDDVDDSDPTSAVGFRIHAGVTYHIAVDGAASAAVSTGTITLNFAGPVSSGG